MKNKPTSIDIGSVKKNANKFSSQKLCEMIACVRYFGMNTDLSVICMEELASRRLAGDLFAFEEVINKCYNELPPLNLDSPDLRTVLKGIIK
jgi:hypothetical protein